MFLSIGLCGTAKGGGGKKGKEGEKFLLQKMLAGGKERERRRVLACLIVRLNLESGARRRRTRVGEEK